MDDALGYVDYADEGDGIHKYHADPDHPDAARELAHFGKTGFQADREGIAIYARDDGTGYVVCTDQIPGNSEYRFYRREGEPAPARSRGAAEGVGRRRGLDRRPRNHPGGWPGFPSGVMAAMNSARQELPAVPLGRYRRSRSASSLHDALTAARSLRSHDTPPRPPPIG